MSVLGTSTIAASPPSAPAAPRGPRPTPTSLALSRAFREASLKSEVHRAWGVIGIAALLMVLVFLPGGVKSLVVDIRIVGTIGVGFLVLVQLITLRLIRRAARHSRDLPRWFVATTVAIECFIPTAMGVYHLMRQSILPYEVLSIPPTYGYGLLICLTVLRLRPWLCVLAGAVSGAGYAGLYLYIHYVMGLEPLSPGMPGSAYVNSALLIVVTGLAAAWVAREVRRHVESALGEIESRHQVARMERDLEVARTIQRALLPKAAPDIPSFDIAGWSRPADQTGGDYYDWHKLPDGNWIVTLADVSGHGVGPALVTAACRAYVRASAAAYPGLPALTARVNALLAQDLPEGRFVTMASVLIDPRAQEVGLLSAGHGPIVLYLGATREVRDILPRDVPLAIAQDTTFGPAEMIALSEGDILALVTDGFVEQAAPTPTATPQSGSAVAAATRGEPFGLERLRDSLRRHAATPTTSESLIKAVAADVAAFAGDAPQEDDLTMVVIRRVPGQRR